MDFRAGGFQQPTLAKNIRCDIIGDFVPEVDAESIGENTYEGSLTITTEEEVSTDFVLKFVFDDGTMYYDYFTCDKTAEAISGAINTKILDTTSYSYVYLNSTTYLGNLVEFDVKDNADLSLISLYYLTINTINDGYPYIRDIARTYYYTEEEMAVMIEDGYIPIATVSDLEAIKSGDTHTFAEGTKWEKIDQGTLASNYLQIADIDFADYDYDGDGNGWLAIGDSSTTFTGVYDGNGLTISNLYDNRPTAVYHGLFGYISAGAEILNLTVDSFTLESFGGTSGGVIGIIAAYVSGSTIKKCHVTSSTINYSGGNYVGGISGAMAATSEISHCSVSDSTIRGYQYIGGIIGAMESSIVQYSSITNSLVSADYFTGEVIQQALGNYVGGIVGWMKLMNTQNLNYITNCSADDVAVYGNTYVGGIIGYAQQYCYAYYIHGHSLTVRASSSTNIYIGGFAGRCDRVIIEDSYIFAYVSAWKKILEEEDRNNYSAAFCGNVGEGTAQINRCYSVSTVSTPDTYDPGTGEITVLASQRGFKSGTCTTNNNFFDSEAGNVTTGEGATAKTTTQMQTSTTFTEASWDFTDDWYRDDDKNGKYPYLLWEED